MLTAVERGVEASRKGIEQAEEEARVIRERFEGDGLGMQGGLVFTPICNVVGRRCC